MKVIVLGASGMIGSAVLKSLKSKGISAVGLSPGNRGASWNYLLDGIDPILDRLAGGDVIVNASGIVKSQIPNDTNGSLRALKLNSLLNYDLVSICTEMGSRLINVTTDCVFQGLTGDYRESSGHDALDVYGKTKSLGEIVSPNVLNLRVSQVGPERGERLLWGWLQSLPPAAEIHGYTNHQWNGISSHVFGLVVAGYLESGTSLSGTRHLVPSNKLSKFQLICEMLKHMNRSDVIVRPVVNASPVNRTLSTDFESDNEVLFSYAGFASPPTIEETLSLQRVAN